METDTCEIAFFSPNVKTLKSLDNLPDCIIILFHTHNDDSIKLGKIFAQVSELAVGVNFGITDIEISDDALLEDRGMLLWVELKRPYIMAFRNNLRSSLYPGNETVSALTTWALKTACSF